MAAPACPATLSPLPYLRGECTVHDDRSGCSRWSIYVITSPIEVFTITDRGDHDAPKRAAS
jgi:hypothetical protein